MTVRPAHPATAFFRQNRKILPHCAIFLQYYTAFRFIGRTKTDKYDKTTSMKKSLTL